MKKSVLSARKYEKLSFEVSIWAKIWAKLHALVMDIFFSDGYQKIRKENFFRLSKFKIGKEVSLVRKS